MKQKQWMKWVVLALSTMAAGTMVVGCGSDHDRDAPPETPSTTQSGKVVQGAIAGARVFADLDGDRVWDSNESFTFSDENGDFELILPAGEYFLVSTGGTNRLTGEEAGTMSAPKDAKNITPLTDLVVLAGNDAPAVQQIIAGLSGGAGYDVDISREEGISSDLMKLVKTVEGTRNIFKDLGKGDSESQSTVVKNMAVALKAVNEGGKPVDDLLQEAAGAAVELAIDEFSAEEGTDFEVTEVNKAAFKSAAANMVEQILANVDEAIDAITGAVVEDQNLQDLIQDKINALIDLVNPLTKKVSIEVGSYDLLDAQGNSVTTVVDGVLTAPADQAEQVAITLDVDNDFDTDKVYPGVTATLTIDDANSNRLAIFNISGLTVTVSSGRTLTVDDSAAVLEVQGQNADGSAVVTKEVDGSFEVLDIIENSVTLDLTAVQDLLAAEVSEDFATVGLAGTYNVTVQATGAPVVSYARKIVVE